MGEMFGRRIGIMAAAAISYVVAPFAAAIAEPLIDLGDPIGRERRSRGRQAKPKRRPNMLLVSRRVRRRHRRRR